MTPEHEQALNEIEPKPACRLIDGLSIRFVAPVIIACLMAASSAAQTARDVRGAAAVEPLQHEPPAKIIIDPPLPEPLSRGRVVIQYRTENLHIVPVFGPAALAVSPRVGHIHVTVDDAPWGWADASGEPVVVLHGTTGSAARACARPSASAAHDSARTGNGEPPTARSRRREVHGARRAEWRVSRGANGHKRTAGEDHHRCSGRRGARARRAVHSISYREPAHCAGLWTVGARRGSPDWTHPRDGRRRHMALGRRQRQSRYRQWPRARAAHDPHPTGQCQPSTG